jgi:uncharacterized protein YggT (Ycf19 family)
VTTAPGEVARPRLRPLSLGETLDVSIKICAANWRTLLKTVLVIVVPVEIVSTAVSADSTRSSFDLSTSSTDTTSQSIDNLNQQLGGIAISSLLRLLALLLVSAACFRVIAQAYLGETTDWRSSLGFALRRAGPLLWLGILYGLAIVGGLLLLIVGAVWLYVAFAFAIPVLFVEGLRGTKALGRSFALVKGRWWRTFGVLTVGFLLGTFVSSLVQGVFVAGIFAGSDNDALVLVLSTIAGIVGLAISTPFQAAIVTVVYFDLRVRKEGFDLELLAREMAGDRSGAAPGTPPPASRPQPVLVPEEVDRGDAPFWPPPPGWKPPERDGAGTDDGPRLPGVP